MATKVVKATVQLGQANEYGLSFPESAFMSRLEVIFQQTQDRAAQVGGVTTGPARVYLIVEQDVVTNE